MILDDTKPDPIDYLDRTAASPAGAAYKRELLEALDLRPGLTVLDLGCGPGTDLAELAAAVTESGAVLGVDRDPAMIDEARRRLAAWPNVRLKVGDAHDLPLGEHSVDRVRVDRVLHQVDDPVRVIAELRRVLRPGGVAALAQPDYDTLIVDPGDAETTRTINRFVGATIIRHATIGRCLGRLAETAGFEVRSILTTAPNLREFSTADMILGLRRNASRAVAANHLPRAEAEQWLTELTTNPFLATFILFTVVIQAPRKYQPNE
jgi:ubiquinone/menaquinone biosynthesis C-methylase UbiE